MQLGFIGAGFISGFQAKAMTQLRGIEVGGILRRSKAEELAAYCRDNYLGNPKIFDSISEMAKEVDVLALYAPNHVRIPIMEEILDAVKAGAELKGLICEKPLGRNMREARKIVELGHATGVPTAYFENQIYMRPLQIQRQQLEKVQHRMGPMSLARSAEEHGGPHEAWFWDPTRQGGGVLSDMGCHSIAVGRYILTPQDKPIDFLEPVAVQADLSLLKWGQPEWRDKLMDTYGVDYSKVPAEDFATGTVTYRNPDTGQKVQAQFTNSWMFEKQGLRILMDGTGPGYTFELNSLNSPLTVFIGDAAAEAIADSELALEKATTSRGLMTVQPNEADLYGYTDENRDMVTAFHAGRDAMLTWDYGLEVTKLVMAAYMAHEKGTTLNLTDKRIQEKLETYVPAIQQGRGSDLLY